MTEDEIMEIISEIMERAAELGWEVAIPNEEGSSVRGIILGSPEFIEEVLGESQGVPDDETVH